MKRHIPNIITLCNVVCGCLSIVSAAEGNLIWAAYFIFIATIFDFADGLAARALKVQSEIGKQLDSLADMVTFGVAPGILMYYFMSPNPANVINGVIDIDLHGTSLVIDYFPITAFLAFLIPMFSALRLAKFNVDESQTREFKGLATPACALFFAGLVISISNTNAIDTDVYLSSIHNGTEQLKTSEPTLISMNDISALEELSKTNISQEIRDLNEATMQNIGSIAAPIWAVLCFIFSLLLVVPIRMFSFKFKNMSWHGNEIRCVFMGIALLAVIGGLLIKNIFVSVPIIILLYVITSMIYNIIRGKNEIQS